MPTLAYHVVDVFTDRPYAGNPLAVVLDADDLSTEQLQAVAREFNLSETAFPLPPSDPARPTTGCGSSRRARSCRSPGTRASGPRGCWPGWAGSGTGAVRQECGAGILPIEVDRATARR